MTYPALPDRRMPYDNDNTVVAYGNLLNGNGGADLAFAQGLTAYVSGSDLISFNAPDTVAPVLDLTIIRSTTNGQRRCMWFFFPEGREVTGLVIVDAYDMVPYGTPGTTGSDGVEAIEGSSDTTSGVDGTWEAATVSGGVIMVQQALGAWRAAITTISFTGAKQVVRLCFQLHAAFGGEAMRPITIHFYGEKASGQTPDDILFLDAQNADAQFIVPIDFGNRPLGTTATHQWKIENASATKTANSINLQCNDADFAISTDGVTYGATINITSLAAGAKTAAMYVRDTTPNPGATLGPRFARIIATVGSWT